jgi:putative salt-induced outer membrane protein YdiY
MAKRTNLLYLLVSLLLIVNSVRATEIVLKNGDRLSGKIIERTSDAVILETDYAGRLKIDRTYIETISEGSATTKSAEELRPTAAEPAKKAEPEKAAAAKVPVPPAALFTSGKKRGLFMRAATGWDGNANLGFSYTSGNSNNIILTTGLRASKSTPNGGVSVYIRSLWNSTKSSGILRTTQNAYWGGGRYDRNINRKFFGFMSYDFERDKPKRLNFRSVVGGGIGHHTIKNENTELELLVGLAWNRTWQTGGDTNTPEGLGGLTFKHKINSRLKFQNSFTYFQNVTDRTEYRMLYDATVSADVTKRVGIFFSIGDRFNNDPVGVAKKNDFLFTTGLKWNFGKKK